jgi:hypothetical protein
LEDDFVHEVKKKLKSKGVKPTIQNCIDYSQKVMMNAIKYLDEDSYFAIDEHLNN